MTKEFAVATVMTLRDQVSPAIKKIGAGIGKFSTEGQASFLAFAAGSKAAIRSIFPEASRLQDVIKGVTIGNLLSKGISSGVNIIRNNMGAAINYASDLIETQNVVKMTFGESEKAIDNFAKAAGKGFGLTELQAKKYASTMGSIFSGMGIKGDNLVDMSKGMTALAGDLASLKNLTHDDAFNKLRAGITGQTEPLRELGIVMLDKNLQDFATKQGIKGNIKDMDQAAQAALRYQFIMANPVIKQAMGDYAKDGASWAVSTRNLSNAINDMRGKLVMGLLPGLIRLADMATEVVQKISAWAEENKEVIKTKVNKFIDGVTSAAKSLYKIIKDYGPAIFTVVTAIMAFQKTIAVLNTVSLALKAMGVSVTFATGPIGLIVAGVAAAVAVVAILTHKLGGLDKALLTIGQTILKALISPINMAIDAIQGALYAIGTITGAEWAKSASEGLGRFQDKANTFLTGSSSTMLESGAKGAVKGYEEGGIGGAVKGFYGEGYKSLGETYQIRRAEQIAKETAEGKKDNGEILDKIDELIAGVYKVDGSITDLGSKAPGSKAKGLSYSQMGYSDIWELVRAGA